MLNLREYRSKSQSLADFLPWTALVGDGVILDKDGSFQRTARFRGPDLDSATPAELVATTSRLSNALRRLGSGWAIFVEAQRNAAGAYPSSRFPDGVSELVESERRAQFDEAGAHFESSYYLTLCWLPPAEDAARAEAWLYEGRQGNRHHHVPRPLRRPMRARRRFSGRQLEEQVRTFRVLGIIGVGLFCVALALWIASRGSHPAASSALVAARLVDPLRAEFERCNARGYAALEDGGCHRAWVEHRRRFFEARR